MMKINMKINIFMDGKMENCELEIFVQREQSRRQKREQNYTNTVIIQLATINNMHEIPRNQL